MGSTGPGFAIPEFFYCLKFSEAGVADVKIVQKINTNAALGIDSRGNEVVVLVKGIGFPAVPYELKDLSRIQRTFYNVSPQYLGAVASLPQELLQAAAEIAERAEIELDCELNPNLPFILADHLNFAVERLHQGITLTTPLARDVEHLYPKEFALGKEALELFSGQTRQSLPEGEATSIALHLIVAEVENGDMHAVMMSARILNEVDQIIEQELGLHLDRNSFQYSRFSMHLRFLIDRLSSGQQMNNQMNCIYRQLAREYPDVYHCTQKVARYFERNWGWQCNEDETMYLMLHINRLRE